MWWMLSVEAWLVFSFPHNVVQKRRLVRARDSYGNPTGEPLWGEWETVAEFFDRGRAERVMEFFRKIIPLGMTAVPTDREYRLIVR